MNYYNIDPWNNPLAVPRDPTPPASKAPIQEENKPSENSKALQVYDDHVEISDTVSIMRTPYFQAKLANMTVFDGFVGRWYFPAETLEFQKSKTTAIVTGLIIDTAKEISVGVGYEWPPVVLGNEEMQL